MRPKPNGALGPAYVVAIRPFRYLGVYAAAMRQVERDWHARVREPVPR